MLSEDDIERHRHDQLVRQILNTPGRAIPLRRLFSMTKYPPDVMVLYAEGYSVANFLVSSSNRGVFLNFVAQGMHGDWDAAVRANYGYNNVEGLEKAWVESLYHPRQQPAVQLASRPAAAPYANPSERVVMRQTAPPAPPLLEAPRAIVRGQAPEAESNAPASPQRQRFAMVAAAAACSRRRRRTGGFGDGRLAAGASAAVGRSIGAPHIDATPAAPRLGQPVAGNASAGGYFTP